MPWIIDRDLTADIAKPAPSNENAEGMTGPAWYAGDGSDCPFPFRMFDGDGRLYYEGRCSSNNDADAFGPLDDFGIPNAGCTRIEYLHMRRKIWQPL